MTENNVNLTQDKVEPTNSALDAKLYAYTTEDAPADVVINVGRMDLMVGAQHATSDPQRVGVGDRRRGPYYLTLIDTPCMIGLQRLKDVDKKRLEVVNKLRRQRVGEEMEDWKKKVHARSVEQPDGPPPMLPSQAALTPLQRAAQGL